MSNKTKKILKNIFYMIAFAILISAFIVLSEKYASNSKDEIKTITDYYKNIENNNIEPINGTKFINLIKKGTNVVLIGSHTSDWAERYVQEIDEISEELNIDIIYYYDINNDKAQKNSNYYKIKELLKGYLTKTDGSNSNLLAPSIYIIKDGEVKYYNTDTVAMPNKIEIKDYWTEEKEIEFDQEISEALNKSYLNN